MSLLITGGLGFLGVQSALHFIRRGAVWSPLYKRTVPLTQLTLFDVPAALEGPPLPDELTYDDRVRIVTGDLTEQGVAKEVVDDENLSIVHLASMVSGDTEADPERGWRVNVEGQRALLEAIREQAPGARFLFTSSTAALGPVAEGACAPDDLTKLLPQNTYGFHKAVCELMVNEYGRRGWVDARGLRLPVVVVRPGAPNAALTGAWSSVVREPLAGADCIIPIPLDVVMPVASYQTVVGAIGTLLNDIDSSQLGADRTLMLPSLSASPAELHAAAAELAAEHGLPLGEARARAQVVATRVVTGMGSRTDGRRGESLGLTLTPDPHPEARPHTFMLTLTLSPSASRPHPLALTLTLLPSPSRPHPLALTLALTHTHTLTSHHSPLTLIPSPSPSPSPSHPRPHPSPFTRTLTLILTLTLTQARHLGCRATRALRTSSPRTRATMSRPPSRPSLPIDTNAVRVGVYQGGGTMANRGETMTHNLRAHPRSKVAHERGPRREGRGVFCFYFMRIAVLYSKSLQSLTDTRFEISLLDTPLVPRTDAILKVPDL